MKLKESNKLRIIPLGGLEQIGMNITAFEYEDSIIVVDCGLAFPEEEMLGIDLCIPDITYLKENEDKVKGFVITHGHEDHIGALPYILKDLNVPVYATKLTIGLIENKLAEHGLLRSTRRKTIKFGQSINLGQFRIEFIKTNHSIQDAAALAIYSPAGIVVHTGDFKVDYTPVVGDAIDLQRFAEIGKKGVLALMCDSTNAERKGFTMSERTVGKAFDNIFNEHKNTRIIIATFASNVDRVQQIINAAHNHGRKVVVQGRSMVNVITTAQKLGYLNIPDHTLIDIDEMKNYPDEKMTLVTTGSQGESMAALSRMASNLHRKVSIHPGDTIIFSSNPIPGNEKAVSKVINELSAKGATVIFSDVHVSGHACQEEIKLIYTLVQPKYAIPVHGEYRHLKAQAGIAAELGIPKENIRILRSGEVLEINEASAEVTGKVPAGAIMVDGLGVGDVGNIVLRDRQHLSEDGIIVVVLTLDRYSNQLLAGPDLVSRGFVYVRESEDLMEEARVLLQETVEECIGFKSCDWNRIKSAVKETLGSYVWKKTQRRPMILPIIMEA
ncbi:MAG: ribonuclease J [Lachnospiraceae bacterium]|nr:ribonuclease J [Lachnospiraceae bacterium]